MSKTMGFGVLAGGIRVIGGTFTHLRHWGNRKIYVSGGGLSRTYYIAQNMHIHIKRGLDLDIAGAPEQVIRAGHAARTVGLVGDDFANVKTALDVDEGDRVQLGQTLMTDARRPDIRFTAPAAGTVVAIHRGARRRLVSIVIEVAGEDALQFPVSGSSSAAAPAKIRETLLLSGAWTALRARPFDEVADPNVRPRAILINAIDTNPLAPRPDIVIGERPEAFHRGIRVVSRLCDTTFVCTRPDLDMEASAIGNARRVSFSGPHPAGLPGTQIHYLARASERTDIWHIAYQDVIAIGELWASGRLSPERVVALGGAALERPGLVRARLGAALGDLLGEASAESVRVISGSPLAGRAPGPQTAYLGRYDTQVTLLYEPHGSPPGEESRRASTALHGWPSGMLSVEAFERIWPFTIPPMPLLRALLVGDVDTARDLGCLGLQAEDLALCSYVCPAKHDYGAALSGALRELHAGR